jgi:hypothetical protein
MVERYAKRDGYTVIATARDPKSMPKVETGSGSQVIVVTMDQAKPKGCLEVSHPHFAKLIHLGRRRNPVSWYNQT